MKQSLIALAVADALAVMAIKRAHTQDVAFQFRMGAGFPGDVNRTHPASIIPGLNVSATQVVRLYGDAVLIEAASNGYRGFETTDTTTPISIAGVAVRPYPTQQTSGGMTATFGVGVPPVNQPLDVLTDGYIMVQVNNGTPVKGGLVYVYVAASSTPHVLGSGFETAAGSNLVLVTNAKFNGPADANGVAEIHVWSQA